MRLCCPRIVFVRSWGRSALYSVSARVRTAPTNRSVQTILAPAKSRDERVAELERVGTDLHRSVQTILAPVEKQRQTRTGRQPEVQVAVRTDFVSLFQLFCKDHLLAARTFLPQFLSDVALRERLNLGTNKIRNPIHKCLHASVLSANRLCAELGTQRTLFRLRACAHGSNETRNLRGSGRTSTGACRRYLPPSKSRDERVRAGNRKCRLQCGQTLCRFSNSFAKIICSQLGHFSHNSCPTSLFGSD